MGKNRLRSGLPGAVPLCAGLLLSFAATVPVWAEDKGHCPDNPAASYRFFDGESTARDKARLEALAPEAKSRKLVCILTFASTEDGGYSKKLAIRRAKWVLDTLTGQGVPRNIVAVEIRAVTENPPPDSVRHVEVIFSP